MSNYSDFTARGVAAPHLTVPQPKPQGSFVNSRLAANIPVVGTTDYIEINSASSVTRFDNTGTQVWSVTDTTMEMNNIAGIAIVDAIVYVVGWHTTGTLIGMYELALSNGATTDKFTTSTYTQVPRKDYTFVDVTPTEVILYSYGYKYVLNKSTGALTSEVQFDTTGSSVSLDETLVVSSGGSGIILGQYNETDPFPAGSVQFDAANSPFAASPLAAGFTMIEVSGVQHLTSSAGTTSTARKNSFGYYLRSDVEAYYTNLAAAVGITG